jgi:S1-C subfamily serine protease
VGVLDELQTSVERIAEQLGPTVVGLGRFGSGVVVAEGQVLTNAHNVRHEMRTVVFGDGRTAEGTVAGVDVDGNVALILVDTSGAPAISWALGTAAIGQPVFALANPGGSGLRVGFGLVSGSGRTFRGPRGRRITTNIEHNAPLLRGSSGGPVVDAEGRLLGLNTLRLEGGLILALAADDALRSRVEELARGDSPQHRELGIALAPAHATQRMRRAVGLPERAGLLVRAVKEGSAADRAGLEGGDLLVTAAGQTLESLDDLFEVLDRAGASLDLTVVRALDERQVTVALEEEAV